MENYFVRIQFYNIFVKKEARLFIIDFVETFRIKLKYEFEILKYYNTLYNHLIVVICYDLQQSFKLFYISIIVNYKLIVIVVIKSF